MWLQAQHLHTSAERRQSPAASLSSPELLSDLFTCSTHAAQAKKDEGNNGREEDDKCRGWKGAGGGEKGEKEASFGQVRRDRGE